MRYPGMNGLNFDRPGKEFMLWSPWVTNLPITAADLKPDAVRRLSQHITEADRDNLREKYDPAGNMSDQELATRLLLDVYNNNRCEFHWYQLFTHMLLHDTSSILGFAMHLGGNMLFLLVFGTRVNALIGDLATAILYPVLGVCAGTAQLLAGGTHLHGPMLGASGAIMGMAGVYLILFPVHQVVCAMWLRLGLLLRAKLFVKIFQVRGFWVLLIYFGYDLLMNAINSALNPHGDSGGVAHWAHIGGFSSGMVIGMGIMFSRQFNANNGDLLSIVLGKFSWPLIGKPSQWKDKKQSLMGTLAFSGAAVCVLIAALMTIGMYDPRTPAEKLIAQLSAPGGTASVDSTGDPTADPSSAGGDATNVATPAAQKQPAVPTTPQFTDALPSGATKTDMIGGTGGSPYVRVSADKKPIIGFAIKIGQWSGHDTIGHIDPIFEARGDSPPEATVCVARDGYVVSGIVVNKKDGADGIQILFSRATAAGPDVGDSYPSEWFGLSDGDNQTQLAGHGEKVIGTFGRQGLNNDALGLVIDGAAAAANH